MNRRKQIETYTSIEKCVYDRNRKIFNDIEIIEGLSVKQVDSEKNHYKSKRKWKHFERFAISMQ